ncbi:MAG: hypothetical protein IJT25_01955 [Clostridia bacterium]|nr:hypothetical protein [Clostridia bacterium]
MKLVKKSTSITLTVIMSVLLCLALILTFVPMKLGSLSYSSFAGNLKYASDLKGGMFGEYYLEDSTSTEDINKAVNSFKTILNDQGYPNAVVLSVGAEKIRVEIGNTPNYDYSKTRSLLTALGVGEFDLRTSTDEKDIFISGRQHITKVQVGSSANRTYVQISFNAEGLEAYKAHMNSKTTVYVYMGGNLQTSFSGSSVVTDDMYLTFTDYDSAEDFALKVKLGSLVPIDFKTDETVINFVSTPYSSLGLTADINNGSYHASSALVAIYIVIGLIMVGVTVYAILRYKAFGVANLLSGLFAICVMIFLMQALPFVELSISSLIAIFIGVVVMEYGALNYVLKVQEEFSEGKTLVSSLESGYKKSIALNVATVVCGLIISAIVAVLSSGAIRVGAIIIAISMLASALNNLCLLPWFVKIYYCFGNRKESHYGLNNGGATNENN